MTASRTGVLAVSRSLAVRDLSRVRRYPSATVGMLFLPLFFVVVWSFGFGATAHISGFPARSLLDWILPLGVVSACSTASMIPGFAVARDLEGGFFDRLLAAPMRPVSIVIGPLAAGVGRSVIPFLAVTITGLMFGVDVPGGPAGLLLLAVAALGTGLCGAAWAIGLALRLGSVRRSTHMMQTGAAVVVYLSTGLAPLSFMSPWLRTVSRLNPVTQVLTLGRQGFLGPVTWGQTWPGLVVLAVSSALLTVFAFRGLRRHAP